MRFNAQEITGSRVGIRYAVELIYEIDGPAEFLLNVHAAVTPRQTVAEERFSVQPLVQTRVEADPATGNRIAAFHCDAGTLRARYSALVHVAHDIRNPDDIVAEGPASLPVSTLRYLYPSRYCQADLVQQAAWDQFGNMPRGYGQIAAIRDWVESGVRFAPGVSSSCTSVLDTLRDRAGVCRDFAHVMIAYCRALNYPARFVTGVDYGAAPELGPPDFHAYVEVFVGGAWFIFDPTGISPVTSLIRIGTGRDAADVSFATIFGPVRTGMPIVTISAVDDPATGMTPPVPTLLAVSTAA
ncbi:MAG: transglutaminase family protein [Casimicrobiaceae bacterium]